MIQNKSYIMLASKRHYLATGSMRSTQREVKKLASLREKDNNYRITPEWFIGFFEAEGSFVTTTKKSPRIEISQHASDIFLLLSIKNFFGSGTVRFDIRKSPCALYTISDKNVIAKNLLPLFDQFLFLQNKVQVYENWKSVHFPICKGSPLGTCIEKKMQKKDINPQWLCGFTDGDGSFHCILRKQKDYKCGQQATMVFDLSSKRRGFTKNKCSFFRK